MMRFSYLVMAVVLSFLLQPAVVQAWTPQEIRAMPPYCAGRYARHDNPIEYKRWEESYGPDFLHTHHLCDGIGKLNNYYKAKSPQERKGLLNEAMGNFNYMIQHAKPGFKLMPDVYWYRSRAYALQDQMGQAVGDLHKAIELDPKQARFYTQAAEYLEKLRQRDEALKLVSEALRHLPDHKGLQVLYGKLGGQQPYPEPYASGGAKKDVETDPAPSSPLDVKARTPRSAVFDLSRNTGAGRNEPAILNAGAYLLVEVREDLAAPDIVYLRIQSQIPQPAARIPSIAIDTGRFSGRIHSLEVKDSLLGQYYPLRPTGGNYSHAYWSKDFSPDYLIRFTIDAKKGKLYDPRALSPGSSLNLVLRLAPATRFEDLLESMKLGLRSPDGVRIGVIAHHLMGYRPDPTQTIMDDAGFLTGSLRRLTGFDETQPDPMTKAQGQQATQDDAKTSQAGVGRSDSSAVGEGQANTASQPQPGMGTTSNPWCRFCPETSGK